MAKKKNIECDAPVIRYEADPATFKTVVLKVHKKLESGDDIFTDAAPVSAGEKDAMLMSQEFPGEQFITVYENGIPITLTVNELVRDVILSVFNQQRFQD